MNWRVFVVLNYILYTSYKKKIITSNQLVSSFVITWSILSTYQRAIDSAWNLSEVYGLLYNVEDYFNKIAENNKVLKNEKNENENEPFQTNEKFIQGDIIVSGVYHKYGDNFVLENISMKIKKGEKVAFVGKIGSGKSTLVKLIMGYQPLIMGDITIGGISINDMNDIEIRKNVFYIPQKPKLFNRTLYENIVYGIKKRTTKEQNLYIIKFLS